MNNYQNHGFENREEYLNSLAEELGVPMEAVLALSDLLGENEDFDGLVTSLEDFQYLFE